MVYYIYDQGMKLPQATCVTTCVVSFTYIPIVNNNMVAVFPSISCSCCMQAGQLCNFGIFKNYNNTYCNAYFYQCYTTLTAAGSSNTNRACESYTVTFPISSLNNGSGDSSTGCASILSNACAAGMNYYCFALGSIACFSNMQSGDSVLFGFRFLNCTYVSQTGGGNGTNNCTCTVATCGCLTVLNGATPCLIMNPTYPACIWCQNAFGGQLNWQCTTMQADLYLRVCKYNATCYCIDVQKCNACSTFCRCACCNLVSTLSINCCIACNDVSFVTIFTGITCVECVNVWNQFFGNSRAWSGTATNSGHSDLCGTFCWFCTCSSSTRACLLCQENLNSYYLYPICFLQPVKLCLTRYNNTNCILEYCNDFSTLVGCYPKAVVTRATYFYGYNVFKNKQQFTNITFFCICCAAINLTDVCLTCVTFMHPELYIN